MSDQTPSAILIATESAVLRVGGERYVIHKNVTRVRAGHPMIEGNEQMFREIDVHFDVETARQEPVAPPPPPPAAPPAENKRGKADDGKGKADQ